MPVGTRRSRCASRRASADRSNRSGGPRPGSLRKSASPRGKWNSREAMDEPSGSQRRARLNAAGELWVGAAECKKRIMAKVRAQRRGAESTDSRPTSTTAAIVAPPPSKEGTLARRTKRRRRRGGRRRHLLESTLVMLARRTSTVRDRGCDAGDEVGDERHQPVLVSASAGQNSAARQARLVHACLSDRLASRQTDSPSWGYSSPAFFAHNSRPSAHTFFSCAFCQRACPSQLSQLSRYVRPHSHALTPRTRVAQGSRTQGAHCLCLAPRQSHLIAQCHMLHLT